MASPGTLYYLMIVVFTFNFGTILIVYLAAAGSIPEEIIEAARIDGARPSTITWKIVAPLLKPTTFFILVTQTIAVFQTWVVIQLLTNGGPARSTETIVFQIYRDAFWFNQFGRASAMGMVLLVIIIVITLIQKLYAGKELDY
jgi:multiple sugar transport system permease protein